MATQPELSDRNSQHKPENAVLQVQGCLALAKGTDDTAPFKRIFQGLLDNLLKS